MHFKPRIALSVAVFFYIIALAGAATLDWDPAQSKSATGSGGDGRWYPSAAAWSRGDGGDNQPWADQSDAVFAGNPGTVILNSTLHGGITAQSITFLRGDYFLENNHFTGTATHHVGTLSIASGLFTYHADYLGLPPSDVWDVGTLSIAQGGAMMFYLNNLGQYKNENRSLFSIRDRAKLPLIGDNAAFVTGSPNFNVSVIPSIVYAKYLHLPYYTFVGYDPASNSLRPLVAAAENNFQQCPVLDQTTRAGDNVRLTAAASVAGPKTINSLVLDGCGYAPSVADITGDGPLTISSGGLLLLRGPEHFGNPVIFPPGVEGHVFVGNAHVWTNATPFSPNLRCSFRGDRGLTLTGQPEFTYDPTKDAGTITYNPDPITLSGQSTYTGTTTINAAKVIVSSPVNFGQSDQIVLNAGATLSPTAGDFLGDSRSLTMNPGSTLDAAGQTTTVKDLTFNAGSVGVSLHSSTRLKVRSDVRINDATLKLLLDAAPQPGQKLTLIANESGRAITGVFAGLREGATLQATYGDAAYPFAISYLGGSGHDVILTAIEHATAAAKPASADERPPVIISSPRYSSMAGSPLSFRIAATNHPTHFVATGLPEGMQLDAATGVISGTTPKSQGTQSIALTASDAAGESTGSLVLTILGPSIYTGPTALTPYLGKPATVPGRIFCVDYDLGGPGVAYNDEDVDNHYVPEGCAWYRTPHDDVDLPDRCGDAVTQKGFTLGVHGCGGIEWEKYSIDVATAGKYVIELRACCANAPGQVHLEIDDIDVTGPIKIPATGNWTMQTQTAPAGSISAGQHVMKLCIDWTGDPHDGGMGLNWINFVLQPTNSAATAK